MQLLKKILAHPGFMFLAIVLGAFVGWYYPAHQSKLTFIGSAYLQFLIFIIQPYLFFHLITSIQKVEPKQYGQILLKSILVFCVTGLVAAIYMILLMRIPFVQDILMGTHLDYELISINGQQNTKFVTDFFRYGNILLVILPGIFFGLILARFDKLKMKVHTYLQFCTEFTSLTMTLVLYFAPFGFFAYFASTIASSGTALLQEYVYLVSFYYLAGIIYFIVGFSIFLLTSYPINKILIFWKCLPLSMLTALATCSGLASIPANLNVAKKLGISSVVRETIIPLGAVLHKDGTVLGAVLKIIFVFSVLHYTNQQIHYLPIIGVAMVTGIVMGAIPSGGLLGEMFIISCFGFPPDTLMLIAAISLLIDPLATMINVTGDVVCAMLIERYCQKTVIQITSEQSGSEMPAGCAEHSIKNQIEVSKL